MLSNILSKLLTRNGIIFAVLGVVAIAALGTSGFFFMKYQTANKLLTKPDVVSAEEAKKITDKISKFYSLPKDETPNVATVIDVEKLKDQPFFANAKNDDKVLIYAKAGIAILYRPSDNKIIQVSPVTGAPSASPEANIPVVESTTAPTAKPTTKPTSTPSATPQE